LCFNHALQKAAIQFHWELAHQTIYTIIHVC